MKQYFYTEETINKNFLASYAVLERYPERLIVINTLTEWQVTIIAQEKNLDKLQEALFNGVSDEELFKNLKLCNAEKAMEILFREGLVE